MVLDAMLQRLYASLVKGPSLNARPHNSRQRVDLAEIDGFQGLKAASVMDSLLSPSRAVDCPAKVSRFDPPAGPERDWSPEEKAAQRAYAEQIRLLNKFHDIALDGRDYFNDHGEDALFVAYPLLSVPAIQELNVPSSPRVLAPVAFMPVSLTVKRTSRKGIQLRATGEGPDLLIPNPALLAWVEQQTGKEIDDLFGDESGEDPWKELREILGCVTSAMGIRDSIVAPRLPIERIPKVAKLPNAPAILPCAILGLFPTTNPGLMRDTKWMMERPNELAAPVSLFLSQRVLELREPAPAPPEVVPSEAEAEAGFEEEALVTQADPCQAAAVAHAQRSQAVVVHGPPGTGKSQTIANIIGDHLARQERVLFVCDKRTALDVVKYRLDALGLGELCGVIHDVQRDRRGLYMGIRERLEQMADEERPKSPLRRLENVNQKLNRLRSELQGYFDALHSGDEERRSFHDLVGQWMQLRSQTADVEPERFKALNRGEPFDEATVDRYLADIDECFQHALNAELAENPFHGNLRLTLSEFMAGHIDDLDSRLDRVRESAVELDQSLEGEPLALSSEIPRDAQRETLDGLQSLGSDVLERWVDGWPRRVASLTAEARATLGRDAGSLADECQRLAETGDRELELALPWHNLALSEVNQHIRSLESYLPKAESWTRLFAFRAKRQVEVALGPLGLSTDRDGILRALTHYRRVRSGLLVSDWLKRVGDSQEPSQQLSLSDLAAASANVLAVLAWCERGAASFFAPALTPVYASVFESEADFTQLMKRLSATVERLPLIEDFETRLRQLELFTEAAIASVMEAVLGLKPAAPVVERWQAAQDTLEDVLRFERRLADMPAGLVGAVLLLAKAEFSPTLGVSILRLIATEREIHMRLQSEAALLDITTERVEATLKEFGQRLGQKEALIRERVLFHWRGRQHDRLLASGGSRLNSLGASLRQRLFIRGKRALKLRQMIQAGQDIDGGDPLFDLCPVWMASPSTVAQIFPRQALFDVLIFDEASQCRLEEALPVMLRGKRVVIAGDPKQLPPTRFFESAVGGSEFADAESLEELAEQQLSETEDLLGAALNLDLQSCYLDVHYRSRSESLIGFSNEAFYQSRLQPIPGHPMRRAEEPPLKVYRVDGVYRDRANPDEAREVVSLVERLLGEKDPPSVGIACFNLHQRDVIVDALEKRAADDTVFAGRLELARNRQGSGSFEGLFVKNLENVQGDERDHIIISTTFGPGKDGKFRRHFGALSRHGGERRLNVLVTRSRERIHVLTSIPRSEYAGGEEVDETVTLTGRQYLYRFLRFAEEAELAHQAALNDGNPSGAVQQGADGARLRSDSQSVVALAEQLERQGDCGITQNWGNEGFCIDLALNQVDRPLGATLGVLLDFNRYGKTPDPIKWEHFRSNVLRGQGWQLQRVWTPELFRKSGDVLANLVQAHEAQLRK